MSRAANIVSIIQMHLVETQSNQIQKYKKILTYEMLHNREILQFVLYIFFKQNNKIIKMLFQHVHIGSRPETGILYLHFLYHHESFRGYN